MMTRIEAAAATDGTTAYVVDGSPATLPRIAPNDLLAAWDLAADAARSGRDASGCRAFRFKWGAGRVRDLVLCDRDATCWADAIDRRFEIGSGYGLSVYLRLLALVELLSRASWAAELFRAGTGRNRGGGLALPSPLVRLAAETRLTDEALFDEAAFLAHIQTLPRSPREPPGASSCCHGRLAPFTDPHQPCA